MPRLGFVPRRGKACENQMLSGAGRPEWRATSGIAGGLRPAGARNVLSERPQLASSAAVARFARIWL